MPPSLTTAPETRPMLNKVPQVALLFWVVKIFGTTVGETAADLLAGDVGLDLTGTSLVMAALLVGVLVVQFRTRRYVPAVYWPAVVLVSVVGTLVCDNLVDDLGVSLWTSTGIFGLGLTVTFLAWWRVEGSLSIHTIVTSRREAFYWLAILFTFALGTSVGDLVAAKLVLGHLTAAAIFGSLVGLVAVAHLRGGLEAVLAFWTAYVLTRPFGASIGDLLSADRSAGGLGLGTHVTSGIFLVVIVAAVARFTVQDRRGQADAPRHPGPA